MSSLLLPPTHPNTPATQSQSNTPASVPLQSLHLAPQRHLYSSSAAGVGVSAVSSLNHVTQQPQHSLQQHSQQYSQLHSQQQHSQQYSQLHSQQQHTPHKYQHHQQLQQSPVSSNNLTAGLPPLRQPQPTHTYPSCFGLPYQDHNYVQPPPPSPPPVASPPFLPSHYHGSAPGLHHPSHQQYQHGGGNTVATVSSTSTRLLNGGTTTATTSTHSQQHHLVDIENVSCNTEVLTSGSGGLASGPVGAAHHNRHANLPPPPPSSHSSSSSCSLLPSVDDSVTRCICNYDHDDGFMIWCEKCGVWQHVDCMGLDKGNIPDHYNCERCEPRFVDAQRAMKIQAETRARLVGIDTSATETEDETKQSPKRLSTGATRGRKRKLLGSSSTTHGANNRLSNTGDIKQKGRRKARRGKGKDKPGHQGPGLNRLSSGFKPRKNAAGNHHRKLNMQKGSTLASTPKSPKATRVMSPKAAGSPNKALSPAVLPSASASVTSPPKTPPVFETPRPWYNSGEDSFEAASTNQYSIDIDALVLSCSSNNGMETGHDKPNNQLLDRLLKVAKVNSGKQKLLEAATDIGSSQAMMEYRGKVILRAQYQRENPSLYTKKALRHVLFYSQLDGADLVIDATTFGNEGRFVRRSCCPNSAVRHVLENGSSLRFYLFSVKAIPNGSEVAIPFDFNYHECDYPVECACGKPTCPVVNLSKKAESISSDIVTHASAPKSPVKSPGPGPPVRRKKKQRGGGNKKEDPSPPQPVAKRRRLSPLRMSAPSTSHKDSKRSHSIADEGESRGKSSKVAVSAPVTPSPEQPSPETETDDQKERRKTMSREERKMEAIMKQFALLEKREERRRETMVRLGKSDEYADGSKSPRKRGDAEKDESIETSPEPVPAHAEEEDRSTPVTTRSARGRRRRGGGSSHIAARRKSRVSSGVSSATESTHSADESCQAAATVTSTQSVPVSPSHSSSNLSAAATVSSATPATAPVLPEQHSPSIFRFPNIKRHRMSEWYNEKAAAAIKTQSMKDVTTEDDDDDTMDSSHTAPAGGDSVAAVITHKAEKDNDDDSTVFIRVQSPHSNSLSHMRRRNSTPATMGPYDRMSNPAVTALGTPTTCLTDTTALTAGSAKKRWLRQAMSESSPPPPTPEPQQSHSPSITQNTDFVPLKKRMLARESLGESEEDHTAAATATAAVGSAPVLSNGFSKPNDNLFEKFGLPPPGQQFNVAASTIKHESIKEEDESNTTDTLFRHPKKRHLFRSQSNKTLSPPLPPSLPPPPPPQKLKEEEVKQEQETGPQENVLKNNEKTVEVKQEMKVELKQELKTEIKLEEVEIKKEEEEQPSCTSSELSAVVKEDRNSLSIKMDVKQEDCSASTEEVVRDYSGENHQPHTISQDTYGNKECRERSSSQTAANIANYWFEEAVEKANTLLLLESTTSSAPCSSSSSSLSQTQSSTLPPPPTTSSSLSSVSPLLQEMPPCSIEAPQDIDQAQASCSSSSGSVGGMLPPPPPSPSKAQEHCPDTSSHDLMLPPSSPPPLPSPLPPPPAAAAAAAAACKEEEQQVTCSTEAQPSESEKEDGEITTDDEVQEEQGGSNAAGEEEEQVDSSSAVLAPPSPSAPNPTSPQPAAAPSSPLLDPASPSSSCSATIFLERLQARRRSRSSSGTAGGFVSNDVSSSAGPPTSPYWGEHRTAPVLPTSSNTIAATSSSSLRASSDFWKGGASTSTVQSAAGDGQVDSSSSSVLSTAAGIPAMTGISSSVPLTAVDNVSSSSSAASAGNMDAGDHADSSPVTSSSNSHHNHSKKKLSIREYRQRFLGLKRSLPPTSLSSSSSSKSSRHSSLSSSSSSSRHATASSSSSSSRHLSRLARQHNHTGFKLPHALLDADEAADSAAASPPPPPPPHTTAEPPQTLSLTERLRREFGLEASSEDEEDYEEQNNKKGRESEEEDDVPPPPPPPPPAPSHPTVQPQPVVMGLKGQSILPHHLAQQMPPLGNAAAAQASLRGPHGATAINGDIYRGPLLPTPHLPSSSSSTVPPPGLLPTPVPSASSSSSPSEALSLAAAGAAARHLLATLQQQASAQQQQQAPPPTAPAPHHHPEHYHTRQGSVAAALAAAKAPSSSSSPVDRGSYPPLRNNQASQPPNTSATSSSSSSSSASNGPTIVNYNHGLRG